MKEETNERKGKKSNITNEKQNINRHTAMCVTGEKGRKNIKEI